MGVFSKRISGGLKYLVNGIFIPIPFSFFLSLLLSGVWEGGKRRLVIAFGQLIKGFYPRSTCGYGKSLEIRNRPMTNIHVSTGLVFRIQGLLSHVCVCVERERERERERDDSHPDYRPEA